MSNMRVFVTSTSASGANLAILAQGEGLYIAAGVNLAEQSSQYTTIDSSFGGHDAYIAGSIFGPTRALQLGNAPTDAGGDTIITATGDIVGFTSIGLLQWGYGGTLSNAGHIYGGTIGVWYSGAYPTTPTVGLITNTGTIEGGTTGISHENLSGNEELKLVNGPTGIIRGGTASYQATQSSAVDTIVNTGSMYGDIFLGGGNDNFNGAGGHVYGTIHGGDGVDVLLGGGDAETMNGDNDSDYIRGGGGKDTLDGGDGFDQVDYSDKTSKVELTLNGSSTVTVKVNGAGEDTISNFEGAIGGKAGDKLTGDSHANILQGLGGNDSLVGGGGDDTLYGGAGKDTLDGGSGVDTADYSDRSEKIDVTLAGSTAVTLKVNGVGEDTLRNVENVVGSNGANTLVGDGAANYFSGRGGNDKLTGNGGNDTLQGGGGKDTLDGGAGNDLLISNHGNDQMTGGSGADSFRFTVPPNGGDHVLIMDFAVGVDRIEADLAIQTTPSQMLSYEFQSNASGHVNNGALTFAIYDRSNGTLWYDADGSGGADPVLVATLHNKPDLHYTDIWFV